MKKFYRIDDPFLHSTVIDIIGLISIAFLLGYMGAWTQQTLLSIVIYSALLTWTAARSMFASVSMTMMNHLTVLRIVMFNANVDIKITKLFNKTFGERRLYRRRIELLKLKKKRARATYEIVTALIILLREEGYSADALLFVLNKMIPVGDEVTKLLKGRANRNKSS